MNKDSRTLFEALLTPALKTLVLPGLDVKASKNKLALSVGKRKLGQIYLQHLTKADGYYAGIDIHSCDAMDFCLEQNPPYASRLFNGSFFTQTSLSETDKRFGDEMGGILRTPSPEHAQAAVEKVRERLASFYAPVARHCIGAPLELLDDILKAPDDYAFPFLSALYVAQKHQLTFNSADFQRVVSRQKIMGNRDFDLGLAECLLIQIPRQPETTDLGYSR